MRSKGNAQVMVGIPRGALYDFYKDEAESWGVKLPTFIFQLLKDRHDALHGEGQGAWYPRGVEIIQRIESKSNQSKEEIDILTDPDAAINAFGGEDED